MKIEDQLLPFATSIWETRQAIVFDWYDGPRQGICALAVPKCEFVFDLVDERFNPDGLDDRLFRLRQLSEGTVDEILTLLEILGTPQSTVWRPVWKFPSDHDKDTADAAIESITLSSRRTNIIVQTQDMRTFQGCWNDKSLVLSDKDWFKYLNIP